MEQSSCIEFKRRYGRMAIRDEISEIPRRETRSLRSPVRLEDTCLLDAFCRHREILRRETNFLKEEVTSRGFATFAGKKNYMKCNSNGRAVSPLLFSELFASRKIKSVGVSLPYLATDLEDSFNFLLDESHHLRYRIQSLASILRKFGIPISSEKVKMQLLRMSVAADNISKVMKICADKDKDSTSSDDYYDQFQWESIWGSEMGNPGLFDDITTVSPMQFTPSTPGIVPYSATICPALQIYSLKIVQLNVNLNWPLHVYGVVAARDTVDNDRNLLFYRSRANYQLVTENDPFLRLTGPSRAIVADNPVAFEVDLKIKYPGAEGQDRALFHCTYNWRAMQDTTPLLSGYACSAELSLDQLPDAIQATILGVRLVSGSWPSGVGCRISCSLSAAEDPTPREVELLTFSALDDVPVGSDGYFGLSRNVVTAQLQSTLNVVVEAHSTIGCLLSYLEFPVRQYCQTSKSSCRISNCEVEVIVAWSLLVQNKLDLM